MLRIKRATGSGDPRVMPISVKFRHALEGTQFMSANSNETAKLSRRHLLGATALLAGGSIVVPASGASTASQAATSAASLSHHLVNITAVPDMPTGIEDIADLGEAKLWFADTGGDGEVVVFLHPASVSGKIWLHQLTAFANAGYRAICYSRRSYSGSEEGPESSTATDAGDLLALLDHLGIEKCHAVGAAAGGIRLLDFAVSHQDRLLSMTLCGTTAGIIDPDYKKISAELLPDGFKELPASFRELGPSYRAANPEGTKIWSEQEKSAVPGKRTRLGRINKVTFADLGALSIPVLLMTGDADLYSPPAVFELFRANLPGSEALVIDGAGHAAYWEQPEAFNAAVLDFIGRARG